ncbi:MAG: putative mannose-phosphate guanylyltransferase [Frankiales bacterium]|nr:putative mannose-phosphate guanylyltransferase [Frankiales bacterium]
MRHALILAGGSGTRLWPYSTAGLPKQLVPLLQGRSLLDIAVERARSVVDAGQVWLGAGEQLRQAVSAIPGLTDDRLIIEPSGRDTLPAIALGCATIAASDPDAVVAVLTADHLIEPIEEFALTLAHAFRLVERDDQTLVTFGVVPDHASVGFGYLELGAQLAGRGDARVVTSFREKPHLATAERFVAEGSLWNSGMFVWRAATLLAAVRAFAPDTGRLVDQVLAGDRAVWSQIPKTSVDYGVMEPASVSEAFTVAALPLRARWLDVGSWTAFGDALGRDGYGNAVGADRAVVTGSTNCVVASSDPEHLVTLIGCEGLVVVHTPSATLVVPADQAQRVKELHGLVAGQFPDLA